MKLAPILVALLFATACTSEKSEQTDTRQEPVATDVVESSACYASVMGPDTMLLSLKTMGEEVTGSLTYNFYEKDDNQGTLRGEMRGDTLLADYTFQSEGTESIRQVAFLKRGEGFVEGYGDIEDQGGKMVFKNAASLDFNSGTSFAKVPCTE